ncbi:uncharacterized protein B0P05DRAFT_521954 [Gilbertella persicaria]|uniref:uncharacterized protein n=1 Tax=Gilbertella persicaria TaxID=101096 RepID=UPI00221E8D47|nr:uncharacterized protein B0P05DRAFT_521954 [Gilbertella persicaria]KAI8098442.1 hypothetical protein B0P05DRAFT_521954 [Gilbertella persicaria]
MYQDFSYLEPVHNMPLTKESDFTYFDHSFNPLYQQQQDNLLLASSFYPAETVFHDYSGQFMDKNVVSSSCYFSSPSVTYESSCSSSPSLDFYPILSITSSETTPLLTNALVLPPSQSPEPCNNRSVKQKKSCKRLNDLDHKPFVCHLCSRCFARKHDLQRHIRVHTGAKPYSCLSCSKAFARTDALKRHLRMEDSCRLSPVIQALKNSGSRRYRNL